MTCTATGSSVEGQYENVGSVTGTDTSGTELSADDPSHYFGAVSELTLVKLANGEDANEPPGVEVAEGADVTMTFLVTNSGNIPVKDVVVTDDKGLTPTFRGGDTNGNDELDPEEVWTYDAVAGPAEGSNLSNVGTVTGTDILERPLTASDPANVITAPVVPPPPPPAPPPDVVVTGTGVGSLPRTGTPLALSIFVALVALATGALLLRRRNRRGELG
jgi:LPXTG-motif cell wall-anchored protein